MGLKSYKLKVENSKVQRSMWQDRRKKKNNLLLWIQGQLKFLSRQIIQVLNKIDWDKENPLNVWHYLKLEV